MVLDPIRSQFWEAFRHLFPSHAKAVQTTAGSLTISWSIKSEPTAKYPYATPITIRFEDDLIRQIEAAAPTERAEIASQHEATVRAGLVGYDPYAPVLKSRVIVLG